MANNLPVARIGDVTTLVERPEAPLAGTTYRQIGVRLWGVGAYERESIDGSQTKYATLSRVESGDIIVNKIWARNGSVAVVSDDLAGCFGSGEFPTFAPNREKLDPKWFHWITKTKWFWAACDEKSQGTSGKNRIRPEKFLDIEIPLPPLTEQRRIVERIEALAARVAQAQSLRREADDLTRLYEASIAKSVFKLQLENNGTSSDNLPELPNKWRWARIGDFAFVTKLAGFEFTKHVEYSEFGEVPVIRAQNISKTGFKDGNYLYVKKDLVELLQRSRLQGGEILMVFVGAGIGNVGIAPKNKEFFLGPNVALIRIDENIVDNRYLYEFLKSAIGKSRSRGFSKVTAQGSISMSNIRDIQVPLPTLDEQRRIAAYLDGLQARVSALRAVQAETERELSALMPSVLDRAFKGEL